MAQESTPAAVTPPGPGGVGAPDVEDAAGAPPPAHAPAPATRRWAGGAWRSLLFAPVGDGQTRRRGSDAFRVGVSLLVILCLLYTSDAADEEDSVDIGGRRIIKKK